MIPYRRPDIDETPLSSDEIRFGMNHGLIEGYAYITHGNGDAALRRGWREYLADRMPRLEAELPGISAAVRARAQEMRG